MKEESPHPFPVGRFSKKCEALLVGFAGDVADGGRAQRTEVGDLRLQVDLHHAQVGVGQLTRNRIGVRQAGDGHLSHLLPTQEPGFGLEVFGLRADASESPDVLRRAALEPGLDFGKRHVRRRTSAFLSSRDRSGGGEHQGRNDGDGNRANAHVCSFLRFATQYGPRSGFLNTIPFY